ncbi:MAG: cytochrome C oxidase subunit IV family protein [Candidatus Angelobacter sp.]
MSEQSHPTPGLYLLILAALVIGTCLTWGIAFIDLGIWNPVVALTIAVIKAVLVILFFMHVFYSSKLTKITVAAGFFWLMIMITMSLSDYLTRAFLPR